LYGAFTSPATTDQTPVREPAGGPGIDAGIT
jgi:hypothetical protein